ncbi:MAG: hypothetical protein ABEH59_06525 [Halobacteriales archaeon]
MAVIVDVALPPPQFELGRILEIHGETSVILETMVPLGDRTVPFFRVHGENNGFEASVREHAAVRDIDVISTHDGEVLYALDWDISADSFFRGSSKPTRICWRHMELHTGGPSNSGSRPTRPSPRFRRTVPRTRSPSRSSAYTTPRSPMPDPGTGCRRNNARC